MATFRGASVAAGSVAMSCYITVAAGFVAMSSDITVAARSVAMSGGVSVLGLGPVLGDIVALVAGSITECSSIQILIILQFYYLHNIPCHALCCYFT